VAASAGRLGFATGNEVSTRAAEPFTLPVMAKSHEQKASGLVRAFSGALCSLLLGVLLAGVYLILKPVEIVRSAPRDPVRGVRYFVPGGGVTSAGMGWERKQEALASGMSEVGLVEGDLNAWAQASYPVDSEVQAAKKEARFLFVPGTPNFRLAGGELQVGVVGEFVCFGSVRELILQARGGFERDGAGWRYAPQEVYFGCFPVHRFPVLMASVARRLKTEGVLPSEVGLVLRRAAGLTITADELVVRMR